MMAERDALEVPVLDARGVSLSFALRRGLAARLAGVPGEVVRAVNDVSFAIPRGTCFGLVGESGCGKSTLARMAVGLYRPDAGEWRFEGLPLAEARSDAEMRRRMAMIFQDPYSSLNPRWRVRDIIAEPIRAFAIAHGAERAALVGDLLRQVGLAADDGAQFAHEFSGGQRQRIAIARALAGRPDFLVCDEPTSALDVSVQAQILNLLKDLQERLGLTLLFISHNLAVIRFMADRLGVMYLGRLVEEGPAAEIFARPAHPYTRMLLEAVPDLGRIGALRGVRRQAMPDAARSDRGCAYAPRCPLVRERCLREAPAPRLIGEVTVFCHAAGA